MLPAGAALGYFPPVDPILLPPPLDQHYQALARLGEGAFGVVLHARRRSDGADLALKLLKQGADDPELRRRFEREARLTAGLRHPSLVEVLDAGVSTDGQPWIAYQRIEGRCLGDLRHLPEEALRQVGAALAAALHVAHRAGVIHRDVKPDNVILRSDGRPVLVDFGIARSTREGTVRTADGLVLGTPAFMAPELFRGQPATAASDQWALAASLHELLYGRGVYPGEDLAEILEAATRGFEPELGPGPEGRVPALAPVLQRALCPDPARRFPDLEALAAALLRSDPGAAAAPPRPETRRLAAGPVPEPTAPVAPQPASGDRRGLMAAAILVAAAAAWLPGGGAPAARAPGTQVPASLASPAPPTPAPPEPPERVRQARGRLEGAVARAQAFLPPPAEPTFHSPAGRSRYLGVHGPALLEEDFQAAWRELCEAFDAWLRRVVIWQRAVEARDAFALPGVRETFVELGLRELSRMLDHLWFLRYPRLVVIPEIPVWRRQRLQSEVDSRPYSEPLRPLLVTLREGPLAASPLARAAATGIAVRLDSNDAGPLVAPLVGELAAAFPASAGLPAHLDGDRAWQLLVALAAVPMDMLGASARCPGYRQLARSAERLLDGYQESPGAPRALELRGALLVMAWCYHLPFRCPDQSTPEILQVVDRQLAWLQRVPTPEAAWVAGLAAFVEAGGAQAGGEATRAVHQAMEARMEALRALRRQAEARATAAP